MERKDEILGGSPSGDGTDTPAGEAVAIAPEPARYPVLMKPKEAAELLRINISTLYPLLAKGGVPGANKIGGEWRIHRDILLDWFQGKCRVSRSKRRNA